MILDPKHQTPSQMATYLQSAVAPRPIALVSSVDENGYVNLSPFSFFNCFSINPPILVFSPSRRVRDNTTKHTLDNVKVHQVVVINVVNFAMVEQTSLASTEYEKGVNEFVKAGFTEEKSVLVKPPRVKEAPVSFECKVLNIVSMGEENGAGNLVICEVVLMHFKDDILTETGTPDTRKLDLVARMGDNWYCRASGNALFEINKPLLKKGIGVDQIPFNIRNSSVLTGNNLGRLGNVELLPTEDEITAIKNTQEIQNIFKEKDSVERIELLHRLAQKALDEGNTEKAWQILLASSD
jgi:flavin reductase (DIM6/NTAB) family NADH-FMN oxidoreductase RutF